MEPSTIKNQETLNGFEMLRQVRSVENTFFNHAVIKTRNGMENRYNNIRASLDFTPAMVEFVGKKEDIVAKHFPKGMKNVEPEQELACRQEIERFTEAHGDLITGRIRQVDTYRAMLRSNNEVNLHMIPLTERYIPENITIADLFNAGIIINWDVCEFPGMFPKATFSLSPKVIMAVFTDIGKVHNIKFAEGTPTLPIVIAIAGNFWTIYKERMAIMLDPVYVEWLEKFDAKRVQILEKHAAKDIYGDPVKRGNEYQIDNPDAYEIEIKALEESVHDIVEAKNALMEEERQLTLYSIPLESLPTNLATGPAEVLFRFVKED